jgi:hypothetical protein
MVMEGECVRPAIAQRRLRHEKAIDTGKTIDELGVVRQG